MQLFKDKILLPYEEAPNTNIFENDCKCSPFYPIHSTWRYHLTMMILDPTKKQVEKVGTSWFELYKTYIEDYKLEWGAKIRKAFWIRHLFGIKEPNTVHNPFTQNPFLITASFLYFNGPMASSVATIATNKQIPCWFPMNHQISVNRINVNQ